MLIVSNELNFLIVLIGCIRLLRENQSKVKRGRLVLGERYLPREAQEVCHDCAAELRMDAPRPPTVTASTPLNSLICSNSTAMHTIRTNRTPTFLFSEDGQITQSISHEVGVDPYPARTGVAGAQAYVRHMPHVCRVPDLYLMLMLSLHCCKATEIEAH
jgi:hypothetical protein